MPESSGTLQKRDPPPRTSESGFSTGPLYAPTDIRHRTWRRSYESGLIGTYWNGQNHGRNRQNSETRKMRFVVDVGLPRTDWRAT
jgi:hypothetical protein